MQNTNTEHDEDDEYLERHTNCMKNHGPYREEIKGAKDIRINGVMNSQAKVYICRKCNPRNVQSEDNK